MLKRRYLAFLSIAVVAATAASIMTATSVTWLEDITQVTEEASTQEWKLIGSGVGESFRAISFVDEIHGYAITTRNLWKTNDGGQTWLEVRIQLPNSIHQNNQVQELLEDVQFLSISEGWLLRYNYLLHTSDGGTSWRKQEFDNVQIRSFRFLDENNGWFVGERYTIKEAGPWPYNGTIYATTNGGLNWHNVPTGISTSYNWRLFDIWPVSTKNIWAVGDIILHSENGGENWNQVDTERIEGFYGVPMHIEFVNSDTGWIRQNTVGDYWITTDGGKKWEIRQGQKEPGFADLIYITQKEAWAVGSGIYQSNDGGKSWLRIVEGKYETIQYVINKSMLFAAGDSVAICKCSKK